MLCQSFPCLPSDSPLLLRGLTPAKDIPHALYPLVSVRCNQLGWSSGILVSRKKRKARTTPSQPPVITSSTGSKFSLHVPAPIDRSVKTFQPYGFISFLVSCLLYPCNITIFSIPSFSKGLSSCLILPFSQLFVYPCNSFPILHSLY